MTRISKTLVIINVFVVFVIVDAADEHGSHPCDRECDGKVKECYYDMVLESYATMSKACYHCPFRVADCDRQHCIAGNGLKRLVLTVNRQFPAPTIKVCHRDTIIVNVTNMLMNFEGTTMHWHGLHQEGTPYMDGVPFVTQCPLHSGASWHYRFVADPPGTHWYHAHTGPQRADGLAGALIVREQNDTHKQLYEADINVIMIQDWEKTPGIVKAVLHETAKENNKPDYLLINGKGGGLNVEKPSWITESYNSTQAPYAVLRVGDNTKHRFRMISNAVLNCPVEVFIQDHNVTVIASDGSPMQPVTVNSLTISGGERYDFIVTANQPADNYWIYVMGQADCAPGDKAISQLAVLRYESAPNTLPTGDTNVTAVKLRNPDWLILNPFNLGTINKSNNDNYITLAEMFSAKVTPDWITQKPAKTFYLGLDLFWIDNPYTNDGKLYSQNSQIELQGRTVIAQINQVSLAVPDRPYLTQYSEIPQDEFCTYKADNHNYLLSRNCSTNYCNCIHRMKVALGDVVEMVLIDEGTLFNVSSHSMHIHGYYWAIVATGQLANRRTLRSDVIAKDTAGLIPRNYSKPILKDTILIPDGGFVVTKFKASNPGIWLLHCHNDIHSSQGMSIFLEVGEPESWPRLDNLPICGSYSYNDPPRVTAVGRVPNILPYANVFKDPPYCDRNRVRYTPVNGCRGFLLYPTFQVQYCFINGQTFDTKSCKCADSSKVKCVI